MFLLVDAAKTWKLQRMLRIDDAFHICRSLEVSDQNQIDSCPLFSRSPMVANRLMDPISGIQLWREFLARSTPENIAD
jgi:hypothetical protein